MPSTDTVVNAEGSTTRPLRPGRPPCVWGGAERVEADLLRRVPGEVLAEVARLRPALPLPTALHDDGGSPGSPQQRAGAPVVGVVAPGAAL